MCAESIKSEVARLAAAGVRLRLLEQAGQCYVQAEQMAAPTPLWGAAVLDVLIPIPLAYETAGLDGFYLKLPYSYRGGEHPRVNGQTVTIDATQWRQVSWHYADNKRWQSGADNLETHLAHIKGFFFHRGATNAIN